MGINKERGCYECDRCGKRIKHGECLCSDCEQWLQNYIKKKKEKVN